jgi:hypothetical protein
MAMMMQPSVSGGKPDGPRCVKPVRIDRDMFERQWWGYF